MHIDTCCRKLALIAVLYDCQLRERILLVRSSFFRYRPYLFVEHFDVNNILIQIPNVKERKTKMIIKIID